MHLSDMCKEGKFIITCELDPPKGVNIEEFLEDVASTSLPEMVGPGYRIYVPARERSATSVVALGARGVVAFLADLIPIYGVYRWIRD